MRPPQQPELPLTLADAPPEPVECDGWRLGTTLAELRERGLEAWAWDVKGATHKLHLRPAHRTNLKRDRS